MRNSRTRAAACVVVCLVANTVGGWVNIETVPVGNPGNAGDTRYWAVDQWGFPAPGYGSVAYTYNIGKYEVTAGQYTEFLNAVAGVDTYDLYNTTMSRTDYGSGITRSGGGTVGDPYTYTVTSSHVNRPVNYVSYLDACRFANWLHNGQGNGDTETGAYSLDNYSGSLGFGPGRNSNWKWAVTTEDEWYKAAYYKGGSTNAGYWNYPTSSDSSPGRDLNDVSGNNANSESGYGGANPHPIQSPYYTTVAGEFENSDSPYGTFDQGGNLTELTEKIWWQSTLNPGDGRWGLQVSRGGSFAGSDQGLHASVRNGSTALGESYSLGFRVVQVPEPSALALLTLGGCMLRARRRRPLWLD